MSDLEAVEARIWSLLDPYRGELEVSGPRTAADDTAHDPCPEALAEREPLTACNWADKSAPSHAPSHG